MRSIGSLGFLWLLLGPVTAQTSWTVDGSACDGAGSGSALDPFCTLQEAVDAAASGDRVIVRPGLYAENVRVPAMQLTIVGEGGAEVTEVRAAPYLSSIELLAGAEVRIEGLSLSGFGGGASCTQAVAKFVGCRFVDATGAYHDGYSFAGGGIWAEDSQVSVSGCLFEDTFANFGGAIAAVRSTLRVEDCQFRGGWSAGNIEGGALWLEDVQAVIARCAFEECFVFDHGSAIWMDGGALDLAQCLFADNFVGDYAGTISLTDVDASIRHCSFRDNRSSVGWGGALYVSVGPEFEVTVSDCSFERNSASEGGAVCVRRGFARFQDCSFAGNHAGPVYYYERGYGGGIFVGGFPWDPPGGAYAAASRCVFRSNVAVGHFEHAGRGGGTFGPMELESCTFHGNRALGSPAQDEPTGGAAAGGARLLNCIAWANAPDQLEESSLATWSDVQGGWPGKGNLALEPRFWDPTGKDLHLRSSSPCIDAGDPARLDEDGSRSDIGAYSFDGFHGAVGRKVVGPR